MPVYSVTKWSPFFLCGCCREACETALKQKHLLDSSEIEGFVDEVSISLFEQLHILESVFQVAADADTPQEVRFGNSFLFAFF